MTEEVKKHLPEIRKVFEKHEVIFALLFGSHAKGKTGKLSDVDFAVYLRKCSSHFDLQLKLMGELGRILKKDRVDVVILNQASPLLAQMAIVHGEVIFCQNEDVKANFFTRTLQRFDDALFLMRTYRQYLEKQVFNDKTEGA
jgi:hypothetical protein